MSRTLKGTRARGLPPKLLLSQRQDATGSFPTKWRTASDNRTGKYPVFFNDDKVIRFNEKIANPDMYVYVDPVLEYEENIGCFDILSNTKTFHFSTNFSTTPVVVLSDVIVYNNNCDVNLFLSEVLSGPSGYFIVSASAPFLGSFIYKAAGLINGEIISRKPLYAERYAKIISLQSTLNNTNNFSVYVGGFRPEESSVTFLDTAPGNNQADISASIKNITGTIAEITASALVTSVYANYIGLQSNINEPVIVNGITYPLVMTPGAINSDLSPDTKTDLYKQPYISNGYIVNKPIATSGSMSRNIADSFVTFTPGQDIQAFRDNSNPAVDGKISSSVNGINPFYATGSAVDVTGQGFQQPLWSKSKIEIDITPSESQIIETRSSGSSGCYPMAYWNKTTKKYEGIGNGKGIDSYAASIDGLKGFLSEQIFGYGPSMDNGSVLSNKNLYRTYGRMISSLGYPYHKKFNPSQDQQILVSNFISEPFLIEKIILEIDCVLQHNYSSNSAIWSFFLMNSRNNQPNEEIGKQEIVSVIASALQPSFTTSSLSTESYVDVIDHLQVNFRSNGIGTNINRELTVNPTVTSYTEFKGQMTISSSVKSSLSYELLTTPFSGALTAGNLFVPTLSNSGRNQIYNTNGREWINSFEKTKVIDSYYGGNDIITKINEFYTKKNPYILLPTDKLTFGFQLPWAAEGSATTKFSSLAFAPVKGIHKITLYGSTLRLNPETNQLEEHHDTLNQLLSSNSIYEEIGD